MNTEKVLKAKKSHHEELEELKEQKNRFLP
jgi:hypothetical protein